jgi:hypothetical protein
VPGGQGGNLRDSTEVWGDNDGDGTLEEVNDAGHIVEGSQFEGQVRITNSTIQPGAPNEGSYGLQVDNQGNQINTEQTFLQQFTANTTSSFDAGVFDDYPEGGTLPSSPPQRDPLEVFLDNFGLP